MKQLLPVYDITPFTMLDYADHMACIIWFTGCNFRCDYCHNPDIVKSGRGTKSIDDVMAFLKSRIGRLEAVVLSGGECTLFPNIIQFARDVKSLGFKVKMDTNGTRPCVVKQMVEEGLVDFIALDYKAPEAKFYDVTRSKKWNFYQQTLEFLCSKKLVPFEVRTTVHTGLLNENDLKQITNDLNNKGYEGSYYVQNYRHQEVTLGGLEEQRVKLGISKIEAGDSFKIRYRNF